MKITDEAVEAFKAAWHQADTEGDEGNRVSRGLAAAGPIIAAQVRERVAAEIDRRYTMVKDDPYATAEAVTFSTCARIARGEGS